MTLYPSSLQENGDLSEEERQPSKHGCILV
jgi:hypothetical protein